MATSIQAVDRTSDRPVYKQIADHLRDQMAAGVLAPGQKLPSETVLIDQFQASRATVQRALTVLTNEGRIRTERGVGVFVRERPAQRVVYNRRADRFERRHREAGKSPLELDTESQGLRFEQRVLALEEVPAPAEVADNLDLKAGERVFVRRRLVSLRSEMPPVTDYWPTQSADSYLPLDIAVGKIREEDTGPGGIYARIEDNGHRLTHFEESLRFRMPSPREGRLLRLGAGIPVIDLIRVAYAGPRPVECYLSVMAGDKYSLEYRIPAG